MSLSKRMVSGALWCLLEKGGQQALSFVVFMVLARIVGPDEYGLANICFIYFALTNFIISGLIDGIVSLQIEDDKRLSTLFWLVCALGVGLGLLCAGTAGPLAAFMNEPKLAPLLELYAVVPVLMGTAAIPNLLIIKEIDFKISAVRTLVATFIGGTVGVIMAYRGFGAFSLVWQQITISVMSNLIVWKSLSWRPVFTFARHELATLLKPGLALTGTYVITFLNGQAPRFFIEKILGSTALGFFALATRLSFSMIEIMVNSPLAVVYPGMAKLRDDKGRQTAIIETILQTGGIALFPILALATATAPQYVPLLFGTKWEPAVLIIQIYIVGIVPVPLFAIIQSLFRANNQMPYFFHTNLFVVTADLGAMLLLLCDQGLMWMSLGLTLVSFLRLPVFIFILKRRLGIDLWGESAALWKPVVGSLVCYAAAGFFQKAPLFPGRDWANLSVALCAGSAAYAAYCFAFMRPHMQKIRELIGSFLAKAPEEPA